MTPLLFEPLYIDSHYVFSKILLVILVVLHGCSPTHISNLGTSRGGTHSEVLQQWFAV